MTRRTRPFGRLDEEIKQLLMPLYLEAVEGGPANARVLDVEAWPTPHKQSLILNQLGALLIYIRVVPGITQVLGGHIPK